MIAGLRAKYEEMLGLRRDRSSEPPVARLRALAKSFPGALRELDVLAEDEIKRRLALLRSAEISGTVDPWIVGMHWFHVELGTLLRAKRWLATQRTVDAAVTEKFIVAHAKDENALRWSERLSSIARPPGGKLSKLALEAAASRASLETEELRRWLGPPTTVNPPAKSSRVPTY